MKPFLLFVLFLFTVTPLFAQKDTLRVISHWKNTDIRSYKVLKITSSQSDTEQMKSDTLSYSFRFVVLDSTATGYRIKWDFDESPLYDELNEDEYEDLGNQFGDLQMIYTTDHNGVFKHIENWQDISRYFTIYYNTRYSEEADKDSAQVIESYKQMKEAISTQEGVEQQLFNEMRFFHLPFGYRLPINDTLKYRAQRQVASTNEYALANIEFFFSGIKKQINEAVFNKVTNIDPDDAKKKLTNILQKYADSLPTGSDKEKEEKAEAIKALPNVKYDSNELFTFKFNFQTGFPSKVDFKTAEDIDLKIENHKTIKEIIIEESN